MSAKRERVLVFRIGQLGDTVVALPAIGWLANITPGASRVLLTDRSVKSTMVVSQEVVEDFAWFDEIVLYDPQKRGVRKLIERAALLRRLRALRFTTIVNLAPQRTPKQRIRDRLWFYLVSWRAKYVEEGSQASSEARSGRGVPEWKRLLDVVGGPEEWRVAFPLSEAALQMTAERLSVFGQGPIVAVCPGSKMPSKLWPVENYIVVLRALRERIPNVSFLLVGSADERNLCEGLVSRIGADRALNVAGEWSIRNCAAALSMCDVYLGNDTGVMHLAAAVGTPCIAVFSCRDVVGRWEPRGDRHKCFRATSVSCEGCMAVTCPNNNFCLKAIPPEPVIDAVTIALAESRAW